jgi:caspase-like apoptosis-related cysteine protease
MGFIYSRDTPYKPESLWKAFTADKCPTLAGKPKLFFLQVKQCLRFHEDETEMFRKLCSPNVL